MIFFVFFVTMPFVAGQAEEVDEAPRNSGPRRYGDLKNIARQLLTGEDTMGDWKLSANGFEQFWSQIWSYGCHCSSKDSDRPMSEMGVGVPVDHIDTSCRNYKRCQYCVAEKYNGTTPIGECIGEFIRVSLPKVSIWIKNF